MAPAGSHARKREIRDARVAQWEAEAAKHNQLHSHFFGVSHVPVREIRARLDQVLRSHEIREIMKVDIREEVEDGA
jgi:hypothetical protein